MTKKASSLSKKYLKILGWVSVVLATIGIVSLVASMVARIELTAIIDLETLGRLRADLADDAIRVLVCCTYIFMCLIEAFIGWLLIRAADNPQKTTLILVLTVLDLITGIVALFSSGFNNSGVVLGNIISLTLTVLTLMALMRVRREIDA